MEARREASPMHRAAADALAAVVGAEGQRLAAAGDAQVVPVEVVRSDLVADPVALGVPEGSGVEADDAEAGAREALDEHAAGRADADDHVIHFVARAVAPHGRVNGLD